MGNAKLKTTERKQGLVAAINVEVLSNIAYTLNKYSKRFSMSKSDIISQALTLWFALVEKKDE